MKESVSIEHWQNGIGTATNATAAQKLANISEKTFVKGVWITNTHATVDLLIHTDRTDYPKASNSYALGPGKTIFIPVEDPWKILVRGRTADCTYAWYGL